MTPEELKQILDKHALWLKDDSKGVRANLVGAHLVGAHLEWANLERANLVGANLVGANLERANLEWANLERAHLVGANLVGAILDFSCFPLWCGSFTAKADDRLVLQLFAHIARLDVEACSEEVKELVLKLPELAKNGFCKYQNAVKEAKP